MRGCNDSSCWLDMRLSSSTLAGSAKRAVLRAQPYQLPADKYASWSEVIVNFDPSQMF